MKRTGFRKKTYQEIADLKVKKMDKFKLRKPLKKKSKQKISTIQNKLWELCKQITRKKYSHTCFTCGASQLSGSNLQTGHMWAKASLGAYLKYDLRVLRLQCARCNIFMGGMGSDFYSRMLREIGEEKMAGLQKDRQVTVKSSFDHYSALIPKYKEILDDLNKTSYKSEF